ncbi:MAG: CPBP family intramembrane glutamic endopeptidase [Candidatus Dormibacteria bacterium]
MNFPSPLPENPLPEALSLKNSRWDVPFDWIDIAAYFVIAFLLSELAFPLIVILVYLSKGGTLHSIATLNIPVLWSLILQFAFDLGLLLPVVGLVVLRHRTSMGVVGWRKPTSWWWMVAAPGIVVVAEGVSMLLLLLSELVMHQPATAQCEIIKRQYGNSLALAIIAVCFFAPIAEETAFRGFLYGWMRKHMPVWGAAVASGLVFSLAHTDIQLLIPLWAVGIILALVYERARSLFPGMLIHGLFNLIGIILILKQPC